MTRRLPKKERVHDSSGLRGFIVGQDVLLFIAKDLPSRLRSPEEVPRQWIDALTNIAKGRESTIILFSACLRSIYGTFQDFLFAFVYILPFP